jgi:hypothetical protein
MSDDEDLGLSRRGGGEGDSEDEAGGDDAADGGPAGPGVGGAGAPGPGVGAADEDLEPVGDPRLGRRMARRLFRAKGERRPTLRHPRWRRRGFGAMGVVTAALEANLWTRLAEDDAVGAAALLRALLPLEYHFPHAVFRASLELARRHAPLPQQERRSALRHFQTQVAPLALPATMQLALDLLASGRVADALTELELRLSDRAFHRSAAVRTLAGVLSFALARNDLARRADHAARALELLRRALDCDPRADAARSAILALLYSLPHEVDWGERAAAASAAAAAAAEAAALAAPLPKRRRVAEEEREVLVDEDEDGRDARENEWGAAEEDTAGIAPSPLLAAFAAANAPLGTLPAVPRVKVPPWPVPAEAATTRALVRRVGARLLAQWRRERPRSVPVLSHWLQHHTIFRSATAPAIAACARQLLAVDPVNDVLFTSLVQLLREGSAAAVAPHPALAAVLLEATLARLDHSSGERAVWETLAAVLAPLDAAQRRAAWDESRRGWWRSSVAHFGSSREPEADALAPLRASCAQLVLSE